MYRDTCLALARRSWYVSEMKEIVNDLYGVKVVDGVFSAEVNGKRFGPFTVTVNIFLIRLREIFLSDFRHFQTLKYCHYRDSCSSAIQIF